MATQLLDRVPVDRIAQEASAVRFGRAFLTALTLVFYAIGWTAGKVTVALAWAWAATKVGFQEARNPTQAGPRGRAT